MGALAAHISIAYLSIHLDGFSLLPQIYKPGSILKY